ncbi:penicillin-binding protein activator, partial [Myxococcota bacterium]|nr:penicillin-binding protein activator [Myxococcota bacterium]
SARAAGEFGLAIEWMLRLRQLEPNDAERRRIDADVVELVDTRASFQEVRELLEKLSGDDFPKPLLTYKLGRIQYHTRDLENAAATLQKYLSTWPGGAYEAGAKALLARIKARGKVKVNTVGILLPLSGKNRAYGESALSAIQLAFEGSAVQLVVRDTKSDRAVAAQATEELALDEGVVGIVGPMFTNEAEPAAFKAQELGVPILTFSSADVLGQAGPYVFRNGLTNAAQARALVAYAMDVAGMRTFAILHPRHPYGEELVQHFWDEVDKRKGEIRGIESYGMEDTTFASQVKALVARDVLGLRGDYRKALEECDKQPDNYRKQRCRERATQDVRPIVDFEGLFIPDYPRNIALISAALAFEDIIVETDPRYLRKIEKTLGRQVTPVTLLGASGWNSPELPEKAQRNVENAVFTDAFFAGSEDRATAELVAAFQRKVKRNPTAPDALAFDSARIMRAVVEGEKPASREQLREALRRVDHFPGVTGKTSFTKGPDAEKDIRILTIKNGQIQEVVLPEKPRDDVPSAGGRTGEGTN